MSASNIKKPITLLRLKGVLAKTGLSKSTVYDFNNPKSPRHDATFPGRVQITPGVVGWVAEEIDGWIESRIRASRSGV